MVGAGPIGSYTAYLLAKEGFDVGIFEKKPAIGKDVNCTGIVSRECFHRFSLPSHVTRKQVHSIRAISPSGILFLCVRVTGSLCGRPGSFGL